MHILCKIFLKNHSIAKLYISPADFDHIIYICDHKISLNNMTFLTETSPWPHLGEIADHVGPQIYLHKLALVF